MFGNNTTIKFYFCLFILSIFSEVSAQISEMQVIEKLNSLNNSEINQLINQTPGAKEKLGSTNNNPVDVKKIQTEISKEIGLDATINNNLKLDEKNSLDNKINDLDISNSDESSENTEIDSDEDKTNPKKANLGVSSGRNFFGYDIFKNGSKIFENSNSSTLDPGYLLGPGDEVIIMLWGQTELNKSFIVSKEGYLFIDNIGQVFVNGLTLLKLEKKLFRMFKKIHSRLDPSEGSPSIFFDISLGSSVLKPKRIFVVGEVEQPGAYSMNQSTSIFTSLYYFGGPKVSGSLRDIKIIRSSKEIASIDFYDFLLTGETKNDIRLVRDDVIFIPARKRTVTVQGDILKTGVFELKEDETLIDLIKIAGGLKNTTYRKRIQISRILDPIERSGKRYDKILLDLNLSKIMESKEKTILYDSDIISFYKISEIFGNKVDINGAVVRPGVYSLDKDQTLKDLINKADGILNTAYKQRVDIFRLNYDKTKSLIDIDLEKALQGNKEHNIKLLPNDVVQIYDYDRMTFKTDVSIKGHVKNPGTKKFAKGMQLYDLLFLGGGFENDEHLKNTYFDRAILSRKNENNFEYTNIPFRVDSVLLGVGLANEQLRMGDEVRIFSIADIRGKLNQEVKISGFIKKPGIYRKNEGMKLSDLLFLGGGFSDSIYATSIFMERADIFRTDLSTKKTKILSFNIQEVLNNKNSDKNLILKTGDNVRIYSNKIFEYSSEVDLKGSVKNPGKYKLKENMTLHDLILESGGFVEDIYNFRYEISRIDPENKTNEKFATIISGDLSNSENDYNNTKDRNNKAVFLKPYDLIHIRPDPYFKPQALVYITGFVYYPGEFALTGPNDKVTDIIKRAGGLRPDGYASASRLIRNGEELKISFKDIIRNPRSKKNFNLLKGDQIFIGSKPNLVKISGQISTPGNYQYVRGKSFSEYIKTAGGYTSEAARSASIIKFPDGRTKKMKIYSFSPQILDGSEIIVGKKEDVKPFNITDYVSTLTQIYADFTQAYLMILIASRQ
jgi:polysaccharide biosynthesis/export protein